MTVWTLATWQARPGEEEQLVAAWEQLASRTKQAFPHASAVLLRDHQAPGLFISFGPWDSTEQVQRWRESAAFRDGLTAMRPHLAAFEPHTMDEVVVVEHAAADERGHRAVDRLVRAIEAEDLTAFAAAYAPDAVLVEPMLGAPLRGREEIAAGEAGLMEAFGDITVEVVRVLAHGSSVLAEVVLGATHDGPLELEPGRSVPATGRRIEVAMAWSLELDPESGLVRHERDYFDPATVLAQLGLG